MNYCDDCAVEMGYPLRHRDTKWAECEVCHKKALTQWSPADVITRRDKLRRERAG